MAAAKIIGVYTISGAGRVYVGSSCDVKRRWYHHRRSLRRGDHHSILLQRAWSKYGEDAFQWKIVRECSTPDEALRVEDELIASMRAADPLHGFNISPSATSCAGIKRAPMSAERREFQRSIWLGRRHSDATKALMSESSKRLRLTDEQKRAVGDFHRGKTISAEHRAISAETCRKRNSTPEMRAKVSAALKGRVITPEWRAKLSEAAKRRHAKTAEPA